MRSLLRTTLVAFAAALALAGTARAETTLAELTVDQAAGKLGQPSTYFFDCNAKSDFEAGHVPHAKWVDYAHVKAADLPSDKTATLVFYCHNEH